jgi:hypothetical protein
MEAIDADVVVLAVAGAFAGQCHDRRPTNPRT